MGYDGWKNYETWRWNRWLESEESSSKYWLEMAREASGTDEPIITLMRLLKEHAEEYAAEWMPDQASVFCDFINTCLSEIDWQEIAEGLLKQLAW